MRLEETVSGIRGCLFFVFIIKKKINYLKLLNYLENITYILAHKHL